MNDHSLEQQYDDYYGEEYYDCCCGNEEYEEFVEVKVSYFRGLVRRLSLFLLSRL